jgi:DNA-binding response OmpR family regulator
MKSILIADGNERVAEVFACLFACHDWNVTRCSDGQRAADALGGSAPFDAVLVSNRLHGMSGVELITRVRALDHRKDVPIVMVTGTVEVAVGAAALAAGADDVLYKPVDVVILVDTVSKCVERAHRRRET